MTHWCKETYKKNKMQHLHGGKRERFGHSAAEIDYSDDEEYDYQNAQQEIDEDQENVSGN